MTIVLPTLVAAVLGLLFGAGIGYFIRQLVASRRSSMAESRAQQILNTSKSQAQDIILEAKNTALKTLEESKKEEKEHCPSVPVLKWVIIPWRPGIQT